jgi:hypothetical protein
MLLPEARLDVLAEQLACLPAGDRKAILARLTPRERAQLREHFRRAQHPSSPFSPDIAERLAGPADRTMTAAGREALARAASAAAPAPAETGSLVDALARLWPRRSAR